MHGISVYLQTNVMKLSEKSCVTLLVFSSLCDLFSYLLKQPYLKVTTTEVGRSSAAKYLFISNNSNTSIEYATYAIYVVSQAHNAVIFQMKYK